MNPSVSAGNNPTPTPPPPPPSPSQSQSQTDEIVDQSSLMLNEEVVLLEEMIKFHKKNGCYPVSDDGNLELFFEDSVTNKKRVGVYKNIAHKRNKIDAIEHAEIEKNGDNLEDGVTILGLSKIIWGNSDDEKKVVVHEKGCDNGDSDTKDSSNVEEKEHQKKVLVLEKECDNGDSDNVEEEDKHDGDRKCIVVDQDHDANGDQNLGSPSKEAEPSPPPRGDFITSTPVDLSILFLMKRHAGMSMDGLFLKWVSYDDNETYMSEGMLFERIDELEQRYRSNLDRDIVPSTTTTALMVFVQSDDIWGPLYHGEVPPRSSPDETWVEHAYRIQSAPRFA